jgi:hypothetical protein
MAKTTAKKVASAKPVAPKTEPKEINGTGAKSAPFKLDGSWCVQNEKGEIQPFKSRFRARQYSKI